MTDFSVDFSEIEDLKPVPEGKYIVSVASAEGGTSQSGHPKITLQWQIEGGDHDGRLIFDILSFHPNALFRVKNTLLALGWEPDFNGAIDPEELIGQSAEAVVVIQQSKQIDAQTGEPYPPRNAIKKLYQLTAETVDLSA